MRFQKEIITVFLVILLGSCSSGEDDTNPNPNGNNGSGGNIPERCENIVSTLSGQVLTIINLNCAITGCHVPGGQLPDFTIKSNIIQNASNIRLQTQSGVMPKVGSGLTLTTRQKDEILCWVANGARDN